MNTNNNNSQDNKKAEDQDFPGYPKYPASEDIYSMGEKAEEVDADDITRLKEANELSPDANNEKDFKDDVSGADLDVPGSELDDADEQMGEEDEENNYYSLGGDNHNDLEESKGE